MALEHLAQYVMVPALIPVVTKTKSSSVTTDHEKTGVERTLETSCIENIPQTMDNVTHSVLW